MFQSTLCLTVCLTTCLVSAAPGQTRRAPATEARAAAAKAPLDLSGDLSRLFPANTFFYVEAVDLASAVDQMGGVDTLHRLLSRAIEQSARLDGRTEKMPVTAPELRTLLSASVAVGVFPASPGVGVAPGAMRVAAVLRMASPEAAADLARRATALVASNKTVTLKPQIGRVAGQSITIYPDKKPAEAFSYAVIGNHIVFGHRDGLSALFATASTPEAKTLAAEAAYVSVAQRAAGQNQLTMFVNGRSLTDFFSSAIGAPAPGAPKNAVPKKDAGMEALNKFLGLDALLSIGVTMQVSGGIGHTQFDMAIDRNRPGLIATLTDPPAITLRSAAFLPADSDVVEAFSVDLPRIYDLAIQAASADVTRGAGLPPMSDSIQSFEALVGMKLRDDLLMAFGNEMAVSFDAEGILSSLENSQDSFAKMSNWHIIGLIEVRNPDVMRKAITFLVTTVAKDSLKPVEHGGVELWENETFAVALQDGFAVLGSPADVRRCLDAHRSGETLAATAGFSTTMGSLAGGSIGAVYASPGYLKTFLAMAKLSPESAAEYMRGFENGFGIVVTKDDSGIHSEHGIPVANLITIYDSQLDTLYKGFGETQRKQNESAVVTEMRNIALAQETFKGKAGRYATLRELAAKGMIDSRWSSKTDSVFSGYRFAIALTNEAGKANAHFKIVAVPVFYGESGHRSFYADETKVVRGADKRGAPATTDDRALDEEGLVAGG